MLELTEPMSTRLLAAALILLASLAFLVHALLWEPGSPPGLQASNRGEHLDGEGEQGDPPRAAMGTSPIVTEPFTRVRVPGRWPSSIEIMTVDESGQPLGGIPVLLGAIVGSHFVALSENTTDPDTACADLAVPGASEDIRDLIAAARVFCRPAAMATVPSPVDVEAPVRIVVPPTCSIRVRAEPAGAGPEGLTGSAWLGVRGFSASSPESLTPGQRVLNSLRLKSVPLKDGEAVFRHVGLGLPISLGACVGVGNRSMNARVVSPSRPGEELLVSVGADHSLFRGRILSPGLRVLSDAPVSIVLMRITGSMRSASRFKGRTDEEGRFCITIPSREFADAPQRFYLEVARSTGPAGGESADSCERWLAVLDAPRDARPIVVECGDLIVGPAPVLARGRVSDRSGNALGGAVIQVLARQDPGDMRDAEWTSVPWMSTRSDENGAWRLRGPWERGAYKIRATARGYLPSESDTLNQTDIELNLVLDPGASISGRLILPDEVNARTLRCGIQGVDDAAGRRRYFPVDPTGRFRVSGLPEKAFHFGVFMNNQAIKVVPRVLARRPSEAPDERLSAIDLRDAFICLELVVRDPDGHLLKGSECLLVPLDRDFPVLHGQTDEAGRVTFTYAGRRRDHILMVRGRGAVEIPAAARDQDVRLRPESLLPIALASIESLPSSPLAIEVRARRSPTPGAEPGRVLSAVILGKRGTGLLRLPGAGAYLLDAVMLRLDRMPTPRVPIRAQGPLSVEVVPDGVPLRFILDLDPASIEAGRRRLCP